MHGGMKRAREESLLSPQFKRPGLNRSDPPGPTQIAPAPSAVAPAVSSAAQPPPPATSVSNQKLTTNDALVYLKAVKEQFQEKREKYEEFLEVMRDFKSQRIDTDGVIGRVKELFKGYPELILGFNSFLPKGYTIRLNDDSQPKKPVDFVEAINFVNKIKSRFQHEEHVYKAFLDILNMYRKDNKTIMDVYNEVAILFSDHPDLLDEFRHFLPDSSGTHVQSGRTSIRRDDRSSVLPASKALHVEKKERLYSSHSDRDFSVDRPDLEHERQRRRFDKEKERKVERVEKKEQERDEKGVEHDNKDVESGQRRRKLFPKKAEETEGETPQIGEAQMYGMLSGSGSSYNDKDALRSAYAQEFYFFDKVKEKLQNNAYQEFLKCLHIYSQEIISRNELKNLVNDIFEDHPDLMSGFNDFLTHCENIDGFLAGVFNKREATKPIKIEDKEKDKEHERADRERDRERERERDKADKNAKEGAAHKSSLYSSKEKYNLCKPISELDLSNCPKCSPSYRQLPKNYPMPIASHRNDLAASVLNDEWVSVTSGSEDYSFKHMRKNQYEESLFRCEDDRFELDVLLESVNATTRKVEELIERMQDSAVKLENPGRIETHLTPLNVRCIERLYGDHGLDAMDALRKNPSVALPVILTRLKQKQEEWSRCRSDFNKVWAEIYAKNYHKSLDHRSFYFKQQDTKNLSTKALLAEIKEINEKQRKEDDVLLAIAAGNRRPILSNMAFEYQDVDLHEDLYQIIKYSCGELCGSKDEKDKLIEIWTSILEPVLGVQRHSTEEIEKVKPKCRSSKSGVVSLRESINTNAADASDSGYSKQGHGDENIPQEQALSSRGRMMNGVMPDVQNTTRCTDRPSCKDDVMKHQVGIPKVDEVIATAVQTQSNEKMDNGGPHVAKGEQSHTRSNIEITSGLKGLTSRGNQIGETHAVELKSTTEAGERGKSVLPKEHSPLNTSVKFEREEGELSPNGDIEDNFVAFEDGITDAAEKLKDCSAGRSYQGLPCDNDAAVENDDSDDEGDESAQRSTEDSENVSEAGEDASASESGGGDECLPEGRGDDEDVDHDDRDGKAESEGEAEGTAETHEADGGEIASVTLPEQFLRSVKPLSKRVPVQLHDNKDTCPCIFYGNDSFYVLFRLHQILYERILSAKTNSSAADKKGKNSKDANQPSLFSKIIKALYNLLDGTCDNTQFEDACRTVIGTKSYVLFTLDKLIYKIVKQLQAIASDETDNKLVQLYYYEKTRSPARFSDVVYHENARVILHDESIYRFQLCSNPTKLSIQLMDYGHEKPEVTAVSIDAKFSSYLYNEYLSSSSDRRADDAVYLKRNKKKCVHEDESSALSSALDGLKLVNGLECKMSCKSSKVSYVLDTEDCLFRVRKKRKGCATTSSKSEGSIIDTPKNTSPRRSLTA